MVTVIRKNTLPRYAYVKLGPKKIRVECANCGSTMPAETYWAYDAHDMVFLGDFVCKCGQRDKLRVPRTMAESQTEPFKFGKKEE